MQSAMDIVRVFMCGTRVKAGQSWERKPSSAIEKHHFV